MTAAGGTEDAEIVAAAGGVRRIARVRENEVHCREVVDLGG